MDIDILGVVNVLVRSRENSVYDSRLKIEENSTWYVPRVVGLVEEDVLAVFGVEREVLERAVRPDAVLEAQPAPELRPDCSAYLGCRTGRTAA